MPGIRLPVAVCAAVAEILGGSHDTLNTLFLAAGAPGPPPDLPHHSKWKTWLIRAGNDPQVDTLALIGNLIEEFMDLPPASTTDAEADETVMANYVRRRERLNRVLEEHGFRYFRGGRVLPQSSEIAELTGQRALPRQSAEPQKPSTLEELLEVIIRGLPRAMHPLTHRRKAAIPLSFDSEYDIQDLLHSQLRPWVSDIRPEEFTPSYAGSNVRMDFLLPRYSLVLETKRVRDKTHAAKIGDELIIDIEHYRRHPQCERLWCVIYDRMHLITNPSGLVSDLQGPRTTPEGNVQVRVFVIGGASV